jgi:gliding motility-associated-like protein
MTVTDANGCSAVDEVTVNVIEICIKIMDAFTPNGDGFNERWMVTGASGPSCTRRIDAAVYNRYGNLVYRNDNYQNNWDGTYKGNPLPDGTYYYVLKFTLLNGKTIQKKGNVTILR